MVDSGLIVQMSLKKECNVAKTRKMVPITGRASASFSSMLKLKRIGIEQHWCHCFNRPKKDFEHARGPYVIPPTQLI